MLRAALTAGIALAALAATASGARTATCKIPLHTEAGWEAIFGTRTTRSAAEALRTRVTRVGFRDLVIERVGCPKFAVAQHDLRNRRQAREFAAEAKSAGFLVTLKCNPVLDVDGDWQAVFGYFKVRTAAEALRTRAARVGFRDLDILRNICTRKWYVELDGLKSLAQAREFRAEAKRAGFAVTIKHH